MISVKTGDLLKSKAHALVNTVNCVGVMGKGVALAFKKRYPAMYDDYVERCKRGEVRLGEPYVFACDDGHLIVNFPTKDHWRTASRLSDIVMALDYLADHYRDWGIRSLAVPPLGCGNGQLEWRVVGPTLHRGLSRLEVPVEMFAPLGTPSEQMQLEFFTIPPGPNEGSEAQVFVEPAWIALVEVLQRIEGRQYHWPVGRVRFQKIAYFLTALGIPTALDYRRHSYGPYSSDLKAVAARLVNNGLIAEERLGKMIEMRAGPTFDDARAEFAGELEAWDRQIGMVVDLFARMPTDAAEVAATVHFATGELKSRLDRRPTEREVLREVAEWKARRNPPITDHDIVTATEQLALLRWIEVEPSPDLRDGSDEMLVG